MHLWRNLCHKLRALDYQCRWHPIPQPCYRAAVERVFGDVVGEVSVIVYAQPILGSECQVGYK